MPGAGASRQKTPRETRQARNSRRPDTSEEPAIAFRVGCFMRQSPRSPARLPALAALAADFDGTLAQDGQVGSSVVDSLSSLRSAGLRAFLVTGRELEDLRSVFDRLDLFDAVVAENGAVLFFPSTGATRVIAPPPPPALVELLRASEVIPLFVGRSCISTRATQEPLVLRAVRELGLDWCVVRNNTSLMCLPRGVDKASGLRAILDEIGLDPRRVVAIGDGENDACLFAACGLGVAVANACDDLKAEADLVTLEREGEGVSAFIRSWLSTFPRPVALVEPGRGTKSRFAD